MLRNGSGDNMTNVPQLFLNEVLSLNAQEFASVVVVW